MTRLLEKAISELKRLPVNRQDEMAAYVLELLAAAGARTLPAQGPQIIGRSRGLICYTSSNDSLDDLLTADDIAAWDVSIIDGR